MKKYFCDLCKKEVTQEEILSLSLHLDFEEDGLSKNPLVAIKDICETCKKIIVDNFLKLIKNLNV